VERQLRGLIARRAWRSFASCAPLAARQAPLLAFTRCKAIDFERDTMVVIGEIDHDLCYYAPAPARW